MKISGTLAALALAATSTIVFAADAAPNFAGTWKLNTARSENLAMMAGMQQTATIAQTATALTIKEASEFQGRKTAREIRYDLAGAPVKNDAAMGGQSDTVAKWDGSKLVVTWTTPGAAGAVSTRTETRSLSADGKTMSVMSLRGGADAKPTTMVFEKQ